MARTDSPFNNAQKKTATTVTRGMAITLAFTRPDPTRDPPGIDPAATARRRRIEDILEASRIEAEMAADRFEFGDRQHG